MRRSRGIVARQESGVAFASLGSYPDVENDRAEDTALIDDLLKEPELRENEREAFEDMRDRLNRERNPQRALTVNQREWARVVVDRLGVSYARLSSEKAANVPRGREVKAPDVLSPDNLKAALAARKG